MTDQTPPAQPNEPQPGQQAPAPQAPSFPPNQAPGAPYVPTEPQQQFPTPQPPAAPQYPATTQYPQQPQAPQQYPNQPAGYPGAGAPKPTNTLAIVALILGIVFAPAGIVTGHMALSKIKRTGEGGRGLALAGTIIGYVSTGLAVLSLIFVLIMTFIIGSVAVTAASTGISQLDSLELPDPSTLTPEDPSSGELLDTPEKVLAVWDKCDLAKELNNPSGAFYEDAEWVASQEALAQLMDPSAESDAIRAYVDHMMNGTGFDLEKTAAQKNAAIAAEAKFCTQ